MGGKKNHHAASCRMPSSFRDAKIQNGHLKNQWSKFLMRRKESKEKSSALIQTGDISKSNGMRLRKGKIKEMKIKEKFSFRWGKNFFPWYLYQIESKYSYKEKWINS